MLRAQVFGESCGFPDLPVSKYSRIPAMMLIIWGFWKVWVWGFTSCLGTAVNAKAATLSLKHRDRIGFTGGFILP